MMGECTFCGGPLDPDLAFSGMHPECEAENYRRNLR